MIDTIIEELRNDENFDFGNSKIFELIEAEKIKEFQKMVPTTLLESDFIFIQRKILGFLLFFKSLNASIPILKILRRYNSLNYIKEK